MTNTLVENVKQLKISDRCDRCNAQAFVLVKMVAGELMFCGHHYAKYQTTLNKMAFEVIDERGSINEKNESSPK
jgi:hypothetical protein